MGVNQKESEIDKRPQVLNAGVCVVSSLYHKNLGGLGRQAVLLTEHLSRSGVPIFVIARKMAGTPHCKYDEKVEVVWINAGRTSVHILEDKSFPNLITSLRFSLGALYVLWKRRENYQVVHFHGASVPLMICILPLKGLKKKVLVKVAAANLGTEAGSLKGRYGLLGLILRWLMQRVDYFIATSREIEEGLKRDGIAPRSIHRIPNFVNLQMFCPASSSEKARAKAEKKLFDESVITFSGRLVARKGLPFLLEAWSSVQKEIPSSRLLVLGTGDQRMEYEKVTASCGLSETVLFLGQVDDVVGYLHATDIFVLPSIQEGFPNALLEAMASGLPVVASRIGGVEDMIKTHINGILVTPGNAEELSRTIIHLLQNPEEAKRLGQQAARTIREQYALEEIAKQYLDIYRQIGQSRPGLAASQRNG